MFVCPFAWKTCLPKPLVSLASTTTLSANRGDSTSENTFFHSNGQEVGECPYRFLKQSYRHVRGCMIEEVGLPAKVIIDHTSLLQTLMSSEDNRAWLVAEQYGNTESELVLRRFVKEMEERSRVEVGDASSKLGEIRHLRQGCLIGGSVLRDRIGYFEDIRREEANIRGRTVELVTEV